jgi:hypothetical protein
VRRRTGADHPEAGKHAYYKHVRSSEVIRVLPNGNYLPTTNVSVRSSGVSPRRKEGVSISDFGLGIEESN